jgi:F-type H+-transporting ATPase subunit c
MHFIGVGLTTLALAGAGIGIGLVFHGLLIAVSTNPRHKEELFTYAVIGFAIVEATGLFSLMLAFIMLFS